MHAMFQEILRDLWLVPVGIVVGAIGTLIGAGGGFLLVPLLLIVYPDLSPAAVTSISLTMVVFNASSGTWAYGRMGRIDYKSGTVFAVATIPGAVLGAWVIEWIPRRPFDLVFGVILGLLGVFLLISGAGVRDGDGHGDHSASLRPTLTPRKWLIGILVSIGVGFLSTLLGIGGGIIHVPALVHLLGYSVHGATATSHYVLMISATVATIVHIARGELLGVAWKAVCAGVGAFIGAQIGAHWSKRVSGPMIARGLGVALSLVAVRLILLAIQG